MFSIFLFSWKKIQEKWKTSEVSKQPLNHEPPIKTFGTSNTFQFSKNSFLQINDFYNLDRQRATHHTSKP